MNKENILSIYKNHPLFEQLQQEIKNNKHIFISGITGSFKSIVAASSIQESKAQLIILNDKEEAAYFYNDLKQLLDDDVYIYFLPSTYKRSPEYGNMEPSNIILRTEALNYLANVRKTGIIVTYPLALFEKVPSNSQLQSSTLHIKINEALDIPFVIDVLIEYKFERVDFVYEPGQFSVRGSIIDIYSFANEDPYRIDFFGDEVDSIRTFDLENQLSIQKLDEIAIIPNLTTKEDNELISLLDFISPDTSIWAYDFNYTFSSIDEANLKIAHRNSQKDKDKTIPSIDLFVQSKTIYAYLTERQTVEFGKKSAFKNASKLSFHTSPQPVFHKNFDLLEQDL